jgi:glycerol kinase
MSAAGTHVLAIDQSTSATKAVLFDGRGAVVDKESREHRQIYPQPGWVEHDAEEIWKSVESTARKALKAARAKPSDIAAIGITNQRETTLLWDR